ncbi:MAG: site-specific integrase, partial [Armatimonadetes bacterium]|nr:site-specific integrase [Candidatus Hippobium faecium]
MFGNELLKYVSAYSDYIIHYQNKSSNTVTAYLKDVEEFLDYTKEREISVNNIRNYMADLDKNNVKKISISRKISSLRSFFNFLVKEKIIESSPFDKISNLKKDKKLPNVITENQIEMLIVCPDVSTPKGLRDKA